MHTFPQNEYIHVIRDRFHLKKTQFNLLDHNSEKMGKSDLHFAQIFFLLFFLENGAEIKSYMCPGPKFSPPWIILGQ